MTAKQERFVDEYLVDFNASRAARAAGYGERRANSQGSQLLADPHIQEALRQRKEELTKNLHITQERVAQEIATLGFSNLFDYIEVCIDNEIRLKGDIPTEKQKAVASIKTGKNGVEIKMYDKVRALEILAKYTGLFDVKPEQDEKAVNNFFEAIRNAAKEVDFGSIPELNNAK